MKPFNKYFDHTLLKPDATEAQITRLLAEAEEYGFAAVCINGCHVSAAAEFLQDSDVRVATVVGFPLGAASMDAKAGEARTAMADGADEIDMVINIGAVKDGRWDYIRHEITLLAKICHEATAKPINTMHDPGNAALQDPGATSLQEPDAASPQRPDFTSPQNLNAASSQKLNTASPQNPGATSPQEPDAPTTLKQPVLLKVILETCLLTDEEIILACKAAKRAGADFVKTSTGFSTGGATTHHVRLMKETVGDDMQVKASGGIRTLADARAMIESGADRLGCSASAAIMEELEM